MSASTILFMDFAGFSGKSTSEQKRLVEGLTSVVVSEVRTLLSLEFPPFSGVLTACDGEFHLGGAFVVHG
jgi:hypothetical protein